MFVRVVFFLNIAAVSRSCHEEQLLQTFFYGNMHIKCAELVC